ncbi:GNAT family N-acetyltransferase [Nocardia sp. NPDC049190]|uniref:GNAT family N-acetyltransferase n=1 Tax=Nocardia sp. NPDC049190 TaxID=3155650 RepID=UPI0033EEB6A6
MTEAPWRILRLVARHTRSLAECHIACWREAYQDLVPAHVLGAFDIERRTEQWERDRVRYPDRTHVAIADDIVIGFVSVGPSRDAHPRTPWELHAMYVRSTWHGTGVADDLIHVALDPSTPYSLWVFEQNPRARAFYRRHGFALDGARRAEFFTGTVEVRMVRDPVAHSNCARAEGAADPRQDADRNLRRATPGLGGRRVIPGSRARISPPRR